MTEHEAQKEISNRKYESLCYDATYRVQENQGHEVEQKEKIFNKLQNSSAKAQQNFTPSSSALNRKQNVRVNNTKNQFERTKSKNL